MLTLLPFSRNCFFLSLKGNTILAQNMYVRPVLFLSSFIFSKAKASLAVEAKYFFVRFLVQSHIVKPCWHTPDNSLSLMVLKTNFSSVGTLASSKCCFNLKKMIRFKFQKNSCGKLSRSSRPKVLCNNAWGLQLY